MSYGIWVKSQRAAPVRVSTVIVRTSCEIGSVDPSNSNVPTFTPTNCAIPFGSVTPAGVM